MIKRVVTEYDKNPPHIPINEYDLRAEPRDMRHLFEVDDDLDMIYVYKIENPEQVDFFKKCGVPIDLTKSTWYVECYD
jgi:hypothetical protein